MLGVGVAGVLFKQFIFYIEMLQLEGHDGAIARARQYGEGNERPVAAFDFSFRRHGFKNGSNLRERRAGLVPVRRRDSRQIVRRIEIFRVGIFDVWLGNPSRLPTR